MATFDIATKANLAEMLPCLVVATYIQKEHNPLPSTVSKTFHDGATLKDSKESIRMTPENGSILTGDAILRYLGELITDDPKIKSSIASQIQYWLARSTTFLSTDIKILRTSLHELNSHLTLRTFITGHTPSIADLALYSTIRGNKLTASLIHQSPIQENARRWYTYIEVTNPWLSDIISDLTSSSAKERAAASAAGANFDIDLPFITGPTVTRFPPEPSGYLHIGHAKAALLNDYFAHKSPHGKLICRFDDTNPSKEKVEFQDSILVDLKLMGVVPDKVSFSSDYFGLMYGLAVMLIKGGKAFADDSELGRGDEERRNRVPSKRRGMGVEETLERFEEMKTGSEEGRRWCLRARIKFDSPNGTLRDPVIYRCNLTPHHRTGTEWKIYPTYDFCAPILDSIEGVTLALRTNEYRDRNVQYEWMQEALGLRKVAIWDFSRLNFIRTVLSKRKLTRIVDDGRVWGWDDPRMPTIRGIMRRGMTVPALREFILRQGPSRNILNLEWGALWALNKKHIDPICPRYTTINQHDAVTCHISGIDTQSTAIKPRYIKNLDLGTKKVVYDRTILLEQIDARSLRDGEEITLMNWGNAFVRHITSSNSKITSLDLDLHLEGDVKKTKKITWLAATESNMIPVDLVSFDYLITKDKLEKDDNLESFLASDTETRTSAWADCNMLDLKKGEIVQFERKGYYMLDAEYTGQVGQKMVFFEIPDGRS